MKQFSEEHRKNLREAAKRRHARERNKRSSIIGRVVSHIERIAASFKRKRGGASPHYPVLKMPEKMVA